MGLFSFLDVRGRTLTASPIWGHIWGHRGHMPQPSPKNAPMPLTNPACISASCPEGKRHARYPDAQGLYLEVLPNGGKYWRLKYRYGGKEKRLALGVFPAVTLAKARKDRDAARDQ